jgi:hypothetical protein
MERPLVRHVGRCGGIVEPQRVDGVVRIICGRCATVVLDPSLECVHEPQPRRSVPSERPIWDTPQF